MLTNMSTWSSKREQILHCQIHLGISNSNRHRFSRLISDEPTCGCGQSNEDSEHCIWYCLLYTDPLSYFLFQPVLHDWFNKGRGMSYPFCGMMYIKEPLLLIGKSSPCGTTDFLSLAM